MIDVSDTSTAPRVEVSVHQDAVSGWNLKLETSNFRFTPENVNSANVLAQGHAHLYINGKKLARVYSEWFHVAKLSPGRHSLRITLHANQHEHYTVHGNPVEFVGEIIEQ